MWKALLSVLFLLLVVPSVVFGAGELCTLGSSESLDWGPIGLITSNGGNCEEAARVPDGDDIIIIPDGSVVTLIDDIVFIAAGAALECQDGGTINFSAVAALAGASTGEGAIGIRLWDGNDARYPPGAVEDDVAIYIHPGCTVNSAPGYVEWGQSTAGSPTLSATHTSTNDTTFVWGETDPCDVSVDCAATTNLLCSVWTDVRYQPAVTQADSEGDHFLDESIGTAVAAGVGYYEACFKEGSPEHPWCYSIVNASYAAGVSRMCIDVDQPSWDRTSDSLDKPFADRNLKFMNGSAGTALANPAVPGDWCIDVAAATFAADGDYAGRWFRYWDDGDSEHHNPPKKIARTYNDLTCAKTTGTHDSIEFATENAFKEAWATASTDATIDYGINEGNEFTVVAGLHISVHDAGCPGACTVPVGSGKVLIESTDLELSGVFIAGSGETRLTTVTDPIGCLHIREGGDAATPLPALHFLDTGNPTIDCGTIMGTDVVTGGADMLSFEDTTGRCQVNDFAFRYGGVPFVHAGTANCALQVERIKFQYEGDVSTGDNLIFANTNGFSSVRGEDIELTQATDGNPLTGAAFRSLSAVPMNLNRVVAWGMVDGGIVNQGDAAYNHLTTISNLLLRGASLTGFVGASRSLLPNRLDNCDIQNIEMSSGGTIAALVQDTDGVGTSVTDCIFDNIETDAAKLIILGYVNDLPVEFSNNIFWDMQQTAATGDGSIVSLWEPNDAGVIQNFENLTFGWSPGVVHDWINSFEIIANAGHALEDSFNIGDLLFHNSVNDTDAAGNNYFLDVLTGMMATATDPGEFCFNGGSSTGGATFADLSNIAEFTETSLSRGEAWPQFNNEAGGDYTLVRGSFIEEKGCGALTGNQAPGIVRGQQAQWMQMGSGLPVEWPLIRGRSKAIGGRRGY